MGCNVHPSARLQRSSDGQPEWGTLYIDFSSSNKEIDKAHPQFLDGNPPQKHIDPHVGNQAGHCRSDHKNSTLKELRTSDRFGLNVWTISKNPRFRLFTSTMWGRTVAVAQFTPRRDELHRTASSVHLCRKYDHHVEYSNFSDI
jgi:hypothetical protein